MDFLELLHEVGKLAKPLHSESLAPPTWEGTFADMNVDSLDLLIVGLYMCDIYGISEEIGKGMQVKSPIELKAFIDKHKTKEPESLEAALASIQ
jgi:hypothetical protein